MVDDEGSQVTGSSPVNGQSSIYNYLTISGTFYCGGCYNAFQTITVQGLTLSSGGQMELISGGKIMILPGTSVYAGAILWGHITSNASFCPLSTAPIVASTGQESEQQVLSHSGFMLYPNPTSGNFTLVPKNNKACGDITVEIFDLNGSKVLSENMIGEQMHEFAISWLPGGLYFVKIMADGYVETLKLVRTK